MAASDQQLYAVKGVAYRISGFMFDNTGALITGGLSSLAATVSKDNGSFASSTNAATEAPANSGFFYLDLTATEMTANGIGIVVTCTNTNANATPFVIITYDVLADVNMMTIRGVASQGTPGWVGIDWGQIHAPTSTVSLSGTTLATVTTTTTTTNLTNAPTAGDLTAAMKTSVGVAVAASAVASVTGNVAGNVVGSVGSVAGGVGGNVTGSVGSINGITFPAHFADLAITVTTGQVTIGAFLSTLDFTATMKTSLNAATPSVPTAAAIATSVWQDATAGDFTAAGSIGKSLFTSGAVPGASGGIFIAGTNAATTITTSLTTHLIGTVDTVTTVTNQLSAATIAAATRDVNNTSPAANSLGAAVNNASAPTVVEIDAQLSNTHGSGQWGSSSGSGAFLVTVTVTDNTATLVANANVRVSNNTEGTFVAQTNSSGVASFSLNAAVFNITITKPQTQFTPATITVTTSANFPEVIQLVAIPAPPAGGLICNVFGNFSSLSSGIPSGVQVKFQLSVPSAQSGFILLNDPIIGQISHGHLVGPSAQGYVPLYRNDGITPAATTYLVTCPSIGLSNIPMTLAAPTFDLLTLIPP